MLRKLALTLIPSVAMFSVIAVMSVQQTPRKGARPTVGSKLVKQVAARSGYIVASS